MNFDSHNSYHSQRAVVNFFKCCCSATNLFKYKLKKQFITRRQSAPAQLLQMQISIGETEVIYDLSPILYEKGANSHICKQIHVI